MSSLLNHMKEEAIASRLVKVTMAGLFVQLLICCPLWITSIRVFPAVPLFPAWHVKWGTPVDVIFYLTLLATCVFLFVRPFSRRAYVTLLLLFILFLLEDENRLQPWFYLYLLMLSSLLFFGKKDSGHILTVFRIVLSSVYFWSGLQKLNVHFAIEVFPWVADFTGAEHFLDNHHIVSYFAAAAEALTGILLWIPRLRKVGSIMAIGMHLFILISLGPLVHNWNQVVWPWNVVFAWMAFELFYRTQPAPIKIKKGLMLYHTSFILLIATVMPGIGMTGNWDHFMSDGFYSAMLNEPAFLFPLSESDRLPASSLQYQYYLQDEKKAMLMINYWSLDELKVPMYPEDRVYKEVAKKLATYIHDYDSTGLRITYKQRLSGNLKEAEYPYKQLDEVK